MEAMAAEEAEIPVADAVVRAMAVRCSAAEEQAASAMARVGALEGELSRVAAAEQRWAVAEKRWMAEVALAARRAEDARASAEAARASAAELADVAASATAKVGALEDERSRAAAAEQRWAAAEQSWGSEGTHTVRVTTPSSISVSGTPTQLPRRSRSRPGGRGFPARTARPPARPLKPPARPLPPPAPRPQRRRGRWRRG